jgi:asparagine synthase (glutamine-hydrolysing)
MCGILGIIGGSALDHDRGRALLSKLGHRGPDDYGIWTSREDRILLGHNRLAIQDLSPLGHQPMVSADGRYVIVFNGEIFNFESLRAELIQLGYTFRSTGDTEVVLAAYHAWGHDCVDKGLAGGARRIFLARDRAGEKPLYYRRDKGGLWFASELKALSHGDKVSLPALNHYLALGYVPFDLCLFEGVNKLPAAHCADYCLDTQEFKIWRYWSLPPQANPYSLKGEELAEKVGQLIEDSVRLRLVADVPVGVLLSGGLDSSLVAAAAARVSSRPIQTFTIALPGSDLDEAHHAKKVAHHLSTDHHVLSLGKPSIDILGGFRHLIDEPIADSSILPAWMVFGLARQKVTVGLGGDGGDELFGGYTDYTTSLSDLSRFGYLPPFIFKLLAEAAGKLPAGVKGRNRVASLRGGPLQQLIWGRPYFDRSLRHRIFNRDAWRLLGGIETAPELFLLSLFNSGTTDIDRMTRAHFGSILPDDFLVKVDRASMAHSLEVRAPLLDHNLIEFCFSQVPDHWKVHEGESRRLQRLLAKKWLPKDLDTSRKQGFSIPVNEWLRSEGEGRLLERMQHLPDVIDMGEVRALVRGHMSGRKNGGRLFALIMLSIAMENQIQ